MLSRNEADRHNALAIPVLFEATQVVFQAELNGRHMSIATQAVYPGGDVDSELALALLILKFGRWKSL